jgi:hypothetical protein
VVAHMEVSWISPISMMVVFFVVIGREDTLTAAERELNLPTSTSVDQPGKTFGRSSRTVKPARDSDAALEHGIDHVWNYAEIAGLAL